MHGQALASAKLILLRDNRVATALGHRVERCHTTQKSTRRVERQQLHITRAAEYEDKTLTAFAVDPPGHPPSCCALLKILSRGRDMRASITQRIDAFHVRFSIDL